MILGVVGGSPSQVALAQDSLAPHAAMPADTVLTIALESDPSLLTQGTIGWLRARPGPGTTVVGGEAAGEPIRFERVVAGEDRGLIAVPIKVGDSLRVSIFLATKERIDTVASAIPVRRGGYRRERIAVAPAFAKPDSAAAARIRSDIARSRRVTRMSRERARLWRGPFRPPRPTRITSGFGSARVYNGEVKSRHLGTDFAGAVGKPVHAAGRGLVALVDNFYLAGRVVYIDHGEGLVTAYFHLSRADVAAGDTVGTGQRIGAVGKSGRVTGPHLHWAARYGAISVDPMSLLELERSAPDSSESLRGRALPEATAPQSSGEPGGSPPEPAARPR
jgi:murein DD-endopeptidase MepM/ murein hydrolase activator NlpD